MKVINLFFFAALLSLSWVACKNANTANTENTDATDVVITADSLESMKMLLVQNVNNYTDILRNKIAELEGQGEQALGTGDVTAKVEVLKTTLANAEAYLARINEATPETVMDLRHEFQSFAEGIKMAVNEVNQMRN
ncbi:MAG TPA: hypothetical protein VKZ75_07615 [Cyclobacteriaceae bacterium]|jgi:hypothetical protein|nr:hypothetical protein [Cyclobacteriaceae bacterium]